MNSTTKPKSLQVCERLHSFLGEVGEATFDQILQHMQACPKTRIETEQADEKRAVQRMIMYYMEQHGMTMRTRPMPDKESAKIYSQGNPPRPVDKRLRKLMELLQDAQKGGYVIEADGGEINIKSPCGHAKFVVEGGDYWISPP